MRSALEVHRAPLRWRSALPERGPCALLVLVLVAAACAPAMRPTISGPPDPAQMAEFWNAPPPTGSRDLLYGVGGRDAAPDPHAIYTFRQEENRGFSWKMEVSDPSGHKWDVKFEPEAEPEVVSSRIVWALGYHEVPDYYLPVWTLERDGKHTDMPPARFRPHEGWIKKEGTWSWHANPFVDTKPFRGLIVLMMVLNSTDLKDDNNALYDLKEPAEHAARWYVVKDLGASLGETGRRNPVRGDPAAFAQEGFISNVNGSHVFFAFRGRHQELLTVVHPDDVAWTCDLLDRLSPAEWRDAFRAGGYNDDQTARFVGKIREKIAQGKALDRGAR